MMTILQFQILKILSLGPIYGKDLRDRLNWNKSNPSFYQLMSRMKRAKLIDWVYIRVDDSREAIYSITDIGKAELTINLIKVN
jgi:DNA-binding PadR family transcriptional regulator